MPSSAQSSKSDLDLPSIVEQIDLQLLSSIATRAHSANLHCIVNPDCEWGSYNVVWFIKFTNGDEWVARIPRMRWSPMLERRLRSDMLAVELISQETSMPIPKIFEFSPVLDNALGHPYTLMSRMKGKPLSDLWFDKDWFTEDRRLRVFASLAENLSQLKQFTFPLIGSLERDSDESGGGLRVGPLLPTWNELLNQPDKSSWDLRGPFSTVHEYINFEISRQISLAPHPMRQVYLAVLRLFAGFLPDPSLNQAPFVLEMPDLGFQNILVDDDGTVSGLLDWDGSDTVPRQSGYARYPAWIMRDWNPYLYFYAEMEDGETIPPREELKEDSPDDLQQFRDEYLEAYKAVDFSNAYITRNSHVFEAIRIGTSTWQKTPYILPMLAKHAFGREAEKFLSSFDIEHAVKEAPWLKSYLVEAERHVPPSDEDKAFWMDEDKAFSMDESNQN